MSDCYFKSCVFSSALIDLEQVNEGATLGVSDPALRKLAAVAAGFNCVSWVVLVTVPFIQVKL